MTQEVACSPASRTCVNYPLIRFAACLPSTVSTRSANGYCSFAYSALACLRMGMAESASNNDSPNLHPVFLCERWNDTVQAQVLDKLSVMVGYVPDSNDRDA